MKIKDITINKLKSGKLKKELSDFYELKKIIENNSWHNNESTFKHVIAVLMELEKFFKNNKNNKIGEYLNKKINNYCRKDLLFLATVLHDLGKKETIIINGDISSFPKHEKISVKKTKIILKKFILSQKEKDIICGIINKHSDLHVIVNENNKNLKKQFDKLIELSKLFLIELIIMVMADTATSYLKRTNREEYDFRINFYKNILYRIF
ncbi:MAG TPA: HD domain-containing protein [Candidatus Moranbacteria bacterium]|nr:HD domain-containing protein [Candidatus Moranbacteria bacterium]